MNYTYPFSAFVGQEMMLTGLLLNAINPLIGGILIRGEKGTGKSTVVRALASLLPEIEVVPGCPFGCSPHAAGDTLCPHCREKAAAGPLPSAIRQTRVVELPINATEDRVAGSLDMEHALATGEKRFEPGLLAAANRGILYVDEVNLLDDHIVDILLDSAAMGVNKVEREGVSFTHPARFILVGTMNPEEGDLRPQLLDRFGLCVTVKGIEDLNSRDDLVRRWESFEAGPAKFCTSWEKEENRLKKRIVKAQTLLPKVKAGDGIVRTITDLAVRMGVDGHRADLVILKTAKTRAAFNGSREVTLEDVSMAAKFALYHRMRRQPFDELPAEMDVVDKLLEGGPHCEQRKKKLLTPREYGEEKDGIGQDPVPGMGTQRKNEFRALFAGAEGAGQLIEAGDAPALEHTRERRRMAATVQREKGRLMTARALPKRGRYIRAFPSDRCNDFALDATLRAAAPFARTRPPGPLAIPILRRDWREKLRIQKTGSLIIFVVDASGSMGARLMSQAKAAVMALLDRAYKDRSEAALVAFKAKGAALLLPPTKSISLAERKLRELPTGGTTPLSAGMSLGASVARKALKGARSPMPHVVLVTDGRANVGMDSTRFAKGLPPMPIHEEVFAVARTIGKEKNIRSLVIDTEEKNPGSMDMAREIASHMGARYVAIQNLRPASIIRAVMEHS